MQHHVIAAKVGRSDIRHTLFHSPASRVVIALRGGHFCRLDQADVCDDARCERETVTSPDLLWQEKISLGMDYVTWMRGMRSV